MYELHERIAVGGMAEIYLARESGAPNNDYIVVKRILPHFASDQQLVDMFLDEQRVAATLKHENIVRTYDVGEVEGEYFISMEYLHGEDVRRIFRALKKRRMLMPLDLALTIVAGAARGLSYAHEKKGVNLKPLNIVHRDVTPHNLFVTYDGVVKLLDFGVAKAANRLIQTTVGTVKGKVAYMSPEQCRGHELDGRSDVYALGVTLYELTCGIRLYRARGVEFETMRRIVEEPAVPPTARRPDYPPELERIVLKAMAKDRDKRYQTALAFRADIESFARRSGLSLGRQKLARFMHELFEKDIAAIRNADGDITKIVQSIVAKKREVEADDDTLPSGDFIFSMDGTQSGSHGLALDSGWPDEESSLSSFRHIGRSLSGSLQNVWGAADRSQTGQARSSEGYRRLTQPHMAAVPDGLPDDADDSGGSPGEAGLLDSSPASTTGQIAREIARDAAHGAASSDVVGDDDETLQLSRPRLPPEKSPGKSPKRSRQRGDPTMPVRRTTGKSPPSQETWLWVAIILLGMMLAFWLGVNL